MASVLWLLRDQGLASLIVPVDCSGGQVTATKILWGQILVVFAIVLATIWGATQWTAWRLGFQPQLGPPWFELAGAARLSAAGLLLVVVSLRCLCADDLHRGRSDCRLRRFCIDRHCDRHVGVAGARSQGDHDLWLGALGDEERGSRRRAPRSRWRRAWPFRHATIFVTTGPSMCSASRRPGPAKASALSSRRC